MVDNGDNDKKRGDQQERRTIWLRIFGAKAQNSFSRQVFSKYIFFISSCHFVFSFHSRSPSRPILGMIASDSHSRNVKMDYFIPFPFPNFGNALVHSLPVPEIWEWIFYSLPVPELWEWSFSIPFPFPKFGNRIIHSRSRTPKCHSRSRL